MIKRENIKLGTMVVTIVLSLIFTFFMMWMIKVELPNAIYNFFFEKQCEEMVVKPNDMVFDGYSVNDGIYVSTVEDPQIELGVSVERLSNIKIEFGSELEKSLAVQVYYATGDTGYNEEYSVRGIVQAGDDKLEISIFKKDIRNIRVDIGESTDVQFELDSIIVNSPSDMNIYQKLEQNSREIQWGRFFYQWELLCLVVLFLEMHIFFNIREMYKRLFRMRWIVGGIVLAFLVINQFHGESIAIYDDVVQPGQGSQYVQPLFGEARLIRSDDFVVETPNKMASMADGEFGKYNDISRGTETLNSVNGIYIGYATIGRSPYQFVYKVLPYENAYSFCWYAPIILCYLVAIEFFYILTKKNALISILGASLQILSSFFLWWGFPGFLVGAQASIVCVYYFINTKNIWKKVLFGIGVAISFANYVLTLYPAWIVPMGYVALCFLVWIVHDNWRKIKELTLKDWGIVLVMAVFSASLIISYLMLNQEYIYAITHTLYPGKRVSSGEFALDKLFLYGQSYIYGFKSLDNPPEASVVLCFFPIPTVMAAYYWIREKKKNWLMGGLLIITFVFLIYVTVGLPDIFARITLLSNSTGNRLVDIIGIIQIYFIAIILSRYYDRSKIKLWIGLGIGILVACISVLVCRKNYPDYLSMPWILVSILIIIAGCVILVVKVPERIRNSVIVSLIVISIISSISIRPISKGLDAVTSKPVSKAIQQIVEKSPESKWIAYGDGIYVSGFSLANGAPTINSTNTYPNLDLWEKLDQEGRYEEIYNRYAHVIIKFTDEDTSFDLLYNDQMQINLSYKDIIKTNVDYIFSLEELDVDNEFVEFQKVYDEDGAYIYRIMYAS